MPQTPFEEAQHLLQEAAVVLTDPPGLAFEGRLEYAQVAASVGLGLAVLALVDKLPERK
jgi:hypothetical protein